MTEFTVLHTETDRTDELRADTWAGLGDTPKWLAPKWFYDAEGSALFERITELPEYYQTRAEHEILRRHAREIAAITEVQTLVELGSGSSGKTRLLLDAMSDTGTLKRFVPLDVSAAALRAAVAALSRDYPTLSVHGIVDDFVLGRSSLPVDGRRMVVFLGGTIGNLLPGERVNFLTATRSSLRRGEWLLLGTDLVKDPERLVRAYDDAAGVTAEFNRNVLRVLNRELRANFVPEDFAHVARWDPGHEWIEMRLRATRPMRVVLEALPLAVDFAEAEEIRTEVSAKFRPEGVRGELHDAGFEVRRWWTDEAGDFALSLSCAV